MLRNSSRKKKIHEKVRAESHVAWERRPVTEGHELAPFLVRRDQERRLAGFSCRLLQFCRQPTHVGCRCNVLGPEEDNATDVLTL